MNYSYKKDLFFLLALLFITVPSSAQITNPEGDKTRVGSDKIWAQTLTGSYFNEFWNYQFYFDNGMKAHIIFSAANFGSLKSPVSGVRVSVKYPDGTVYQLSREYPIEQLVQDKENHIFRLHPERDVYFKGHPKDGMRLVINTSKDGVQYDIDLNITNITRGYKWGDGKFTIRNEEIGILTHIPYAEVNGYISVNNNRKSVRGSAYMDHTYQNQTTTRLMKSGYRYVHHEDSNNWDLIYFLLPSDNRNNRSIGYRLTSVDGDVTLTGIDQVTALHSGRAFNTNLPGIVEFNMTNGSSARIARTKDQERFSILSELGWVARRAARTFLGGEVVDFRGEASLQESSQRPKNGDYNFFIVN
jgi:hypothetical protein